MEEILLTVVAALVTGATALAQQVGSEAARDAYHALREVSSGGGGRPGPCKALSAATTQPARAQPWLGAAAKDLRGDSELVSLAGVR